MDWGTLVGTGFGAVVGVGSTLLSDRVRWRRDHAARQQDVKRQLYGEYLAALTRTRTDLKEVVRTTASAGEERARRAGDAYRDGGAYELRYQMAIIAPGRVVDPSETALRLLRDVRDHIRDGADQARLDSEFGRLTAAVKELRDAMRADLGADEWAG
ncbi:hypothetical protein ACIHFE_02335 [Streptomyces sp. NPDC052396]|uniref:hypothetical protein n=1 Tax=Streptomyces sp. NPDC052396 TaxID=3365689 RepID=UPI0037D3309D